VYVRNPVCVRKWVYLVLMDSTEEAVFEARLRAAKDRMPLAEEIRRERQAAVSAAHEAGMTKYKIASLLGVSAPTVTSILDTVRRERERAAREDKGE
jgi:hypothetical protein